MEQNLIAGGYDAVYAAVPNSPTLRRIWHEMAEGADFPEGFGHISFTTLIELERMATELRLIPGNTPAPRSRRRSPTPSSESREACPSLSTNLCSAAYSICFRSWRPPARSPS